MAKPKDETKIPIICEAAMKLVVRHGFQGLKMAQVAQEAGLATGTLYIYFKDKEALINEAFVQTKKEMAQAIFQAATPNQAFYHNFTQMWWAYAQFCIQHPHKMLFVEQFLHSGLLQIQSIEQGEYCFIPLFQFLEQAQTQDLIRKGDLRLLKIQLMSPIHELVKYGLEQGHEWLQQQLPQAFEMAWQALRK